MTAELHLVGSDLGNDDCVLLALSDIIRGLTELVVESDPDEGRW